MNKELKLKLIQDLQGAAAKIAIHPMEDQDSLTLVKLASEAMLNPEKYWAELRSRSPEDQARCEAYMCRVLAYVMLLDAEVKMEEEEEENSNPIPTPSEN